MEKKVIVYFVAAVLVALITASINALIFNTRFAKVTIDAWSFSAGLFLVIEALSRILTTGDPFWPRQFMRFIRIIIGICILTIHTCQLIYGI